MFARQREERDNRDLDKLVERYLRARNYQDAADNLMREARIQNDPDEGGLPLALSLESDPSATSHILFYAAADGDHTRFPSSYLRLSQWVHSSLEVYRSELVGLLYPIFVHCYLEMVSKWSGLLQSKYLHDFFDKHRKDHDELWRDDLDSLRAVTTADHVRENAVATMFREHRTSVSLSPGSFDLLMRFLLDEDLTLILAILNQHVDIHVRAGASVNAALVANSGSSAASSSGGASFHNHAEVVLGASRREAALCNKVPVRWGVEPGMSLAQATEIKKAAKVSNTSGDGTDGAGDGTAMDIDNSNSKNNGSAAGKSGGENGASSNNDKDGERDSGAGADNSNVNDNANEDRDDDDDDNDDDDDDDEGKGDDATTRKKRSRKGKKTEGEIVVLPASATHAQAQAAHHIGGGPGAAIMASHPSLLPLSAQDGGVPMPPPPFVSNAATRLEAEADDVLNRAPLCAPGENNPAGVLPSACLLTLLNTRGTATCCTPAPDFTCVAAGFADATVRIWDLDKSGTGLAASAALDGGPREMRTKRVAEHHHLPLIGHSGPVYSANWSPCGTYLISSGADGTARVWSMATVSNVVVYRGHNHPVWDARFSPRGVYMATGSQDNTARLWSLDRVRPLRIFAGHIGDVDRVEFHPNGSLLATGSTDRTVRLWDLRDASPVRILTGHTGSVSALAFSRDGRVLASAGSDRTIALWDLAMGRRIATLVAHEKPVWSLDFSYGEDGGAILASSSADGTVRVWDVLAARATEQASAKRETSAHLIRSYFTRDTPVLDARFTQRNVIIAAGAFQRR